MNATPSPSRTSALLLCLAALAGSIAAAAEPRVTSVDVTTADPADAPVIRGILTTKPGAPFHADTVAADLRRLGLLGCVPDRFELRIGDDGAAVALAASPADDPAPPALAAVTIEGGVAALDERVRARLSQRPSTLFQTRRVDFLGAFRDAGVIEHEYRAGGYLDARVRSLTLVRDPKSGTARLTFRAKPGQPYTLARITGVSDELARALKTAPNVPWTDELRREILRRAVRFLRERGYLQARVDAETKKLPGAKVDLRLRLHEGKPTRLNRVTIQGAGDLRDRIRKHAPLRPREPVTPSKLAALRRAVDDLGVFTGVEVLLLPARGAPGHSDLVLRLTPFDPARELAPGERLYDDMAANLIRLYNRGRAGLRSFRLRGFAVWGGRTIEVDAEVVRPDYARAWITVTGPAAKQEFLFLRSGRRAAVVLPGMSRALALPESVDLRCKIVLHPPDIAGGRPARVELGAAAVGRSNAPDVLLLGPYCPPVAAFFTELAEPFARTPPTLDAPNVLSFAAGDDRIRLTLGPDRLPKSVVRRDKAGRVTARFDVEINPDIPAEDRTALPAGGGDAAAGLALMVPMLSTLALPDVAARLAEKAVETHPAHAACLSVRGLMRLADGPPEPGLADLRAAAKHSRHPAYALLLAETLIRGRRFHEAADVCRRLLARKTSGPTKLDPGDLILAANLSLRAALNTLMSGPGDRRRRAAADAALAHIGLGEYDRAAALARGVLKDHPDDAQAAELLARSQLSLGRPQAALDVCAKPTPEHRTPQLHVYAALAHLMLKQEDAAARAFGRAARTAPAARNVLLLQERAAGIHPSFAKAAAKVELARAFATAARARTTLPAGAKPVAFVNDVTLLQTDLDALVRAAGGRAGPEFRARALQQLVEDTLVVRWAVSHGATVPQEQIARAVEAEARRFGFDGVDAYGAWLDENGSGLDERRTRITHHLFKQQAFERVLAKRALVRPADVRTDYGKRQADFAVPPSARFRMITLRFERFRNADRAVELARALRGRVEKKPDSFAELAKEYSHDPNAGRGGLWQDVTKGSLLASLDRAVFAAKAGDLIGPVRTDKACHLIRIEDLRPGRTVPLTEAAPGIVRKLRAARARTGIAAWIARLKAESSIEMPAGTTAIP